MMHGIRKGKNILKHRRRGRGIKKTKMSHQKPEKKDIEKISDDDDNNTTTKEKAMIYFKILYEIITFIESNK